MKTSKKIVKKTSPASRRSTHRRSKVNSRGALAYRNDAMVRRFAEKWGITRASAEELFERCKAYLVVGALVREPISPDAATDEMWHWFITYTHDYADYCERFFGHFIHHVPGDVPSETDAAMRERILRAYRKLGLSHFVAPMRLPIRPFAKAALNPDLEMTKDGVSVSDGSLLERVGHGSPSVAHCNTEYMVESCYHGGVTARSHCV